MNFNISKMPLGLGGGGVLPYMAYTGMCRWTGYGFRPLCPKRVYNYLNFAPVCLKQGMQFRVLIS